MNEEVSKKCRQLIDKGVLIPNPATVTISDDVDIERISGEDVTIYPGARLMGEKTLIMSGSRIGFEAPVTLDDTIVGRETRLNGGFFQGAVFLGKNVFGSGAWVRPGTILEEGANAAHTVGLKQTLLFPFVTIGSLVNFCDCFMAGGTSRKNHSEVGSSFIHLNYTPNQDKATPSMMGNVYNGVMLDHPPIFLGGHGAIVGPVKINFGCITAAGSLIRKDELKPNRLIIGGVMKSTSLPWRPKGYTGIKRVFNLNIQYIAAMIALKSWYDHIRSMFVSDQFDHLLYRGLQENIIILIQERIKRLGEFCINLSNFPKNMDTRDHRIHLNDFTKAVDIFNQLIESQFLLESGEKFIKCIEKSIAENGRDYIRVIQKLSPYEKLLGSSWLFEIELKSSIDLIIP